MIQKMMERRAFLRTVGLGAGLATLGSAVPAFGRKRRRFNPLGLRKPAFNRRRSADDLFPLVPRPNVLLITADDMGWDSLGANGCRVPDITPNLDRLASEGVRFEHSHVNIAVCQPCRGTIATGRYSHRNGIEGFEHTRMRIPTVMGILKKNGYLTGVFSKVNHSTPHGKFVWDLKVKAVDTCNGRDPERYYAQAKRFFERASAEGRPFYLMANSQDPHRPFDGAEMSSTTMKKCDFPPPSRRYTADEVDVPGFLPELPEVRKEMAQYYGSVRRIDDTVGALLRALDESGAADNTIVVFLSDHGVSFPFSKANCYPASTRVPWIVRWPGTIAPCSVDREHFVSTIDFMPTILEAVGLPIPEGMDGRSFGPLLRGETQERREMVFKQFHRTSREGVYPMRSVQDKKYCYIFNPWSNGKRRYKAEAMRGHTFRAMRAAAKEDADIASRVRMYVHRTREELYDLQADPYCLNNLIHDPTYLAELNRLRGALAAWMQETGDRALAAFKNPDDERLCKQLVRSTRRGRRRIRFAAN